MELVGVRIENVGGFQTAQLDTRGNKLLVGENNSGKTSLLRVLDWIFNSADNSLLARLRTLSDTERNLLVPARATRNKARRMFLRIAIPDGRTARKYGAGSGIAELRIQFRAAHTYAKISAPSKGEEPRSEAKALELLSSLQENYCALYVAAARDARSQVFSDSLRLALRSQFSRALLPHGQGLTHKARKVRDSTDGLRGAGEREASAVWENTQEHLRGVFAPTDARFELNIDPEGMIDFMIDQIEPTFSLGEHDASRVPVDQLGAGAQSILAMALTQLSMANATRKLLLLEEPEAFLHPSAQRTLAWQLFQPSGNQMIATTHSPLVLAESSPSDVVVLRGHAVYPAQTVSELQESKDRYLMSTWVSGSMFDRSLLLVEGAGDLAFFEALRRKLEGIVPVSVLSRVRVAAVGGKASFGPWLRLLRRYREPASATLAHSVLVCADSVDAGADIIRALRDSTITMPSELQSDIRAILNGLSQTTSGRDRAEQIAERTRKVNFAAADSAVPIHFMPVDLEYSATLGLSDQRSSEFAGLVGLNASTTAHLASCMGSKGGSAAASDSPGAKAPFARAELARFVGWDELSPDLKDLIWRWLLPAFDRSVPKRPRELR